MAYHFQIDDTRVEATAGVNSNAMYLNLKKTETGSSAGLYNSAVGHLGRDSLPRLPFHDDEQHDEQQQPRARYSRHQPLLVRSTTNTLLVVDPAAPSAAAAAAAAPPVRLARSLRAPRSPYPRIPTVANLNNTPSSTTTTTITTPTTTTAVMMQHQQQHFANPDDLYSSLDSYLLEQQSLHQQHSLYQQQQQYYQQQHQQQQQAPHPQHRQQQSASVNGHFQPTVHRHVPSTRSYSYHPYSSTPVTPATPSPPTSYLAPWDTTTPGVGVGSYMSFPDSTSPYGSFLDYDYCSNGTIHPSQLTLAVAAATSCAPVGVESGLPSFGTHALYASPITISPTTISPYLTYAQQPHHQPQPQQQQLPTCIAPEDLYSPHPPMTPVSPRSLQDSASSSDSSSTLDSVSNPSQSTRSSPTRPGLSIPSASLANPISNEAWLNTNTSANGGKFNSSNPSSTLSSPVESLSSHASSDVDNDNEPSFVPPPSLKRSTQSMIGRSGSNKRATRSAGPEHPAGATPTAAWVEAVLAEDARRLAEDVAAAATASTSSGSSSPVASSASAPVASRPTNRPIAFACVFCRHRKIQCIRPKTEVAPGEKPLPCK
ncbi:hypothetical protein FRC17_004470 [Serendipita sp. 399]|nr:hypothetical protein FRC17_004470 [Serendipita sp. 399]